MAELHWLIRLGLNEGRSLPLPRMQILGKWILAYLLALIIGGALGFVLGSLYPFLPPV